MIKNIPDITNDDVEEIRLLREEIVDHRKLYMLWLEERAQMRAASVLHLKDAERYRWLRSDQRHLVILDVDSSNYIEGMDWKELEALDQYIDEVMEKSK